VRQHLCKGVGPTLNPDGAMGYWGFLQKQEVFFTHNKLIFELGYTLNAKHMYSTLFTETLATITFIFGSKTDD